MVGRLVQDQRPGLLRQCPRKDHPLLLAAGQFRKRPLLEAAQSHPRQCLPGDAAVLRVVLLHCFFVRGSAHQHDIPDGKIEIIDVVLRHNAQETRRFLIAHFCIFLSIQKNAACVLVQHPVDAFQKRAFAASVGADDADKFSLSRTQGNLLQDSCLSP